jgi:DNA-binding NarL/FixJ family response regulator
MGKGKKWSQDEQDFLIDCVAEGKDEFKISEEFHIRTKMNIKGFHKRSPAAIKRRIADLPEEQQPIDESKPSKHRKRWNSDEDRIILHLDSLGVLREDIADELNRTESAIESRLQVLKNKKSIFEIFLDGLSGFGMTISRLIFGSKEEGK